MGGQIDFIAEAKTAFLFFGGGGGGGGAGGLLLYPNTSQIKALRINHLGNL